jgi:hypothetical protein
MPKEWMWMIGFALIAMFIVFNLNPFGLKDTILGLPKTTSTK